MALPATDDFNRADGGLGSNWTVLAGLNPLAVVSNTATGSIALNSRAGEYWSADGFSNDQYSEVVISTMPVSNAGIGPAVRMSTSGANTYYWAMVWSDGRCYLYRYLTGASLFITQSAAVFVAGDTVRLDVTGTTLTVTRNGVSVISTTNGDIASGAAGIISRIDASGTLGRVDSFAADATNVAGLPAAPSGLSATAVSGTQIDLSYTDNASNETGFTIDYAVGAGAFSFLTTRGANVTTYSHTGRTPGTSYSYRVRAYNGVGDSAYSSTASATTPAPPAAPSLLVATAVWSDQINLSWIDNSSDETGFQIERSPDGSSWSSLTTVLAGVTSYSNTGLSSETTYHYRIYAYNGVGNSSYSNTANATTLPPQISLTIEIAFASDPFAASPTWVDVTSRARVDEPIIIKRGRQNELGRVEPGRLALSLDNRDRALDPLNTSSPYYPNVKARRRIRVSATWDGVTHRLYVGYCRFSNNWGVADNICRVDAVDAMDMFARIPLVERPLLTWTPTPDTTDHLTETTGYNVATLVGFPGQLRVVLSQAPSDTQTVYISGTRPGGTSVADTYVFDNADDTWEDGITGTGVFTTITAIESTVGVPDIQRAITITVIPAFGGIAGYDTDQNVGDLLSYAGFPSADRSLEDGEVVISLWSPTQTEGLTNSLVVSGTDSVGSALQRVVDTENGLFFIRGDGYARFEGQDTRQMSYHPSPTVLGSGAGEIPYRDPSFDDGDAMVYNQIRLTRAVSGVAPAIADATSAEIAEYGVRPFSRTGLLAGFTSQLRIIAGRLLYHRKAAVPRVTGLTIDANATNYDTVLGWDISTPVTVRLRPPSTGAASSYDKPSWVESLEWRITRSAWTLRLGLSPMELGNDLLRQLSGAGMAFPTSPYADQLFYRSDLDLLCFYDGTRWLTVNEYEVPFVNQVVLPIAANTAVGYLPAAVTYNRYIHAVRFLYQVLTTNNGSNYWTLSLAPLGGAAAVSTTSAAVAAGTWNTVEVAYNSSQAGGWEIQGIKTGAPGDLYLVGVLRYRLVVT